MDNIEKIGYMMRPSESRDRRQESVKKEVLNCLTTPSILSLKGDVV